MAGSNNILTYVLLGGAAYVAWTWYKSQPTLVSTTPTPTPTPTPTITPTPTPTPTASANLNTQLVAAAGGTYAAPPAQQMLLNADQWGYYYNAIPGKTAIPPSVFDAALAILAAKGMDRSIAIPVDVWLAAFTPGLSGLAGFLPMPVFLSRNRGFGGYGLADLRRAGGRY